MSPPFRPTYGADLLDRLEARSRRLRLNAGSLYRLLAQLVEDGLARPVESVRERVSGPGAPRQTYAVTESGMRLLRAGAKRQQDLLDLARRLDLIGGDG